MNKKRLFFAVVAAMFVVLVSSPAMAREFMVGGKPLNLFGYVTQGIGLGLHSQDYYDTEKGLQAALFNILVEGDYSFSNDLKLYASGMFSADWAYDLKHDDRSWNDKLFSDSGDQLYKDDEYWQLLKELHLTYTPPNAYFRVGKQIVKWGETLGFRLMDQINPSDSRRGFADVEFETSVIPIWLVRAEYFPEVTSSWLQDLGFEIVFNPNVDFIPNQPIRTGNDEAGIWAPNAEIPVPGGYAHLGSSVNNIVEPDGSDGFEYAFRVKASAWDSFITLNYFDGVADTPVTRTVAGPAPTVASDGRLIIHPAYEGYYPDFRFIGATFARDFPSLKAGFLGGVAPMFTLEAFYGLDNTFKTSLGTLKKFDELRWAIGADWKVKIGVLNPLTYFSINAQFYHVKTLDYPSYGLTVLEDAYTTTLMVSTQYFHGKIKPSFFWMRDVNNHADYYKLGVKYVPSNEWEYGLGAVFFDGKEPGNGFQVFENKDYLYFKLSYKWG